MLPLLAGTFLAAGLLAWLACWLVRRYAVTWGLVDRPGGRKIHSAPTPLGGGLAIWCGVVLPVGGLLLVAWGLEPAAWWPSLLLEHLDGVRNRTAGVVVLLAGATAMMVLGLIDDRRGLDWRIRLAVQFGVAAICVVTQGEDWRLTAFFPWPPLTLLLSVAWIVGMVNAFNMLDNMDGLSAGVAAIAALVLAVFVLFPGEPAGRPQLFVGGFLMLLVGALGGFLFHNRPPAKLFMGDAGSYLVGFSIAACTLLATFTTYDTEMRHAILAPLCVMAVPLYDMTTVIMIRLREKRSPFEGDKSHFSHRLTDLGMTRGQAVLTIYLTTGTCGLGALLLHRVDEVGALIILALVACMLWLVHILETAARRGREQ